MARRKRLWSHFWGERRFTGAFDIKRGFTSQPAASRSHSRRRSESKINRKCKSEDRLEQNTFIFSPTSNASSLQWGKLHWPLYYGGQNNAVKHEQWSKVNSETCTTFYIVSQKLKLLARGPFLAKYLRILYSLTKKYLLRFYSLFAQLFYTVFILNRMLATPTCWESQCWTC